MKFYGDLDFAGVGRPKNIPNPVSDGDGVNKGTLAKVYIKDDASTDPGNAPKTSAWEYVRSSPIELVVSLPFSLSGTDYDVHVEALSATSDAHWASAFVNPIVIDKQTNGFKIRVLGGGVPDSPNDALTVVYTVLNRYVA